MALKPKGMPTGQPLIIHTIGNSLPRARYQRCQECDTLFLLPTVKSNQNAFCPRCHAKVHNGRDWSLTRLGVMAVMMLILMPIA